MKLIIKTKILKYKIKQILNNGKIIIIKNLIFIQKLIRNMLIIKIILTILNLYEIREEKLKFLIHQDLIKIHKTVLNQK